MSSPETGRRVLFGCAGVARRLEQISTLWNRALRSQLVVVLGLGPAVAFGNGSGPKSQTCLTASWILGPLAMDRKRKSRRVLRLLEEYFIDFLSEETVKRILLGTRPLHDVKHDKISKVLYMYCQFLSRHGHSKSLLNKIKPTWDRYQNRIYLYECLKQGNFPWAQPGDSWKKRHKANAFTIFWFFFTSAYNKQTVILTSFREGKNDIWRGEERIKCIFHLPFLYKQAPSIPLLTLRNRVAVTWSGRGERGNAAVKRFTFFWKSHS